MKGTWHLALRKGVCLVASAALAATMVVALPVGQAGAADDVLTVSTRADLQKFRDAVNGGASYAGTVVKLAGSLSLKGMAWEPIGTKEHPFEGTFDGGKHEISGLTVSGAHELGLFGWVGVGGKVKDLSITNGDDGDEPSTITAQSSGEVVRNVGSIAGYVYGTAGTGEPSIENCKSAADISVESTMVPDEEKIGQFTPEGDVAQGSYSAKGATLAGGYNDDGKTIEYVGGLAGYCAGSVTGSRFTGSLDVTTHVEPIITSSTLVRAVGGVVGQVGGYVVDEVIEGCDDTFLTPRYPQADGSYAQRAGVVSVLEGDANSGKLSSTVDASAGLDRFGSEVSASLTCVGGVAGFAIADVSDCANSGTIETPTAGATGGVVGCLRGLPYTAPNAVDSDAGVLLEPTVANGKASFKVVSTGPVLTMTRCENRADVTGRAIVGGVLGQGGSYTQLTLSKNSVRGTTVTGTRWNKPTVGGIVGQTFGNTSRCYDRADARTYNMEKEELAGGYFVSGICGMTARYVQSDGSAFTSPEPDLSACYSTGAVLAAGDYRQAGVAGENSGFIHDCAFVAGTVDYTDKSTGKERVVADEYGTTAESAKAWSAKDMQGKEFCGAMNATTTVEQFAGDECFAPDFADEDDQLNDGYPVFAFERKASKADKGHATLDSFGLSASGMGTASYLASGNPVPALDVSYQGKKLVQGADYYVLPDASVLDAEGSCRNVYDDGTTGYIKHSDTFKARIHGMGECTTASSRGSTFTASYKVGKGDFSTCTPSITPKTFNYLPQYPDKDEDIVMYDAAGNVVSGDQWSYPADTGACVNFKHLATNATYDGKAHDGYQIEFTANEKSNYAGKTYGFFVISRANLFNTKTKLEGLSWGGKTWWWKSGNIVNGGRTQGYIYSLDAKGNEVKGMSVVYCGEEIRPEVTSLKYEGGDGVDRELVLDSDYRVVYGDPGRDDLIADDNNTNTNVAAGDGDTGTRPCATVRYVPGYTKNFTNYQNFYFDIVKADISDSSQCTVKIPSGITVGDASAVRVTGYTGKEISPANYTVTFGAVKSGKATVTVKGKGNLKGTLGKKVAVKAPAKGKTITSGLGTYKVLDAEKLTVAYTGHMASAAKVSIPASIKAAGKTYKVTQVAKNALKGDAAVGSVTVGKNVSKIGASAFEGAAQLETIVIKTSKLKKGTIGSNAFADIADEPKVTVPAKVLKAYKTLLAKAGLPSGATVKK